MNMQVPALTVAESSLSVTPRAALESAADLARAEKSAATKRAYGSDFAIFRAWCADQGLCALPADPAAVAAFIAAEAGRGVKCSTLGRRVAGIRYSHKLAGLASPTDDERVKAVMRGARRTLGVKPVKIAVDRGTREWRHNLLALGTNPNRAWFKGMNALSNWPRNRLLLALSSRDLKRVMPELEHSLPTRGGLTGR
jgi:hypothetical protein